MHQREDMKTIERLEHIWTPAYLSGDTDLERCILTTDFTEIVRTGELKTLTDELELAEANKGKNRAATPDEGESVADVFYREKSHAMAPQLAPDAGGFIWMPDESFKNAFAQNVSAQLAALLSAVQRPIAVACIQEKSP